MPIISEHTYQPPWWAKNAHLNTIVPNRLRKLRHIEFSRFTLDTPDADFLDIDSINGTNRTQAAILVHGLEGSSSSTYMKGMTDTLKNELDVYCLNLRSCSGRANRSAESYHSGKIDDLHVLIDFLLKKGYTSIHLIGFSLGANLILLYIGRKGKRVPTEIKTAVAISAPCDLKTSVDCLHQPNNRLYFKRFMRTMRQKIEVKQPMLQRVGIHIDVSKIRNFHDFDNQYTAPAHGFKSAFDYYESCSSERVLHRIAIPTLIINALDDSFLSPECYPYSACEKHENVHLLTPAFGGHVGFVNSSRLQKTHWHELQARRFIESNGF